MPPANSRAESPMASAQPHSGRNSPHFLSALRELENPVSSSVLNLANTLTTASPETDEVDDIAAENLRFLRSPPDPQEEWRAENAREQSATRPQRQTAVDHRANDRARRERLTNALHRLQNRMQEHPAYSDRIPQSNNMYDWAPATELDPQEELEQLMQDLREIRPNTHPDVLRALSRTQARGERSSPWATSSELNPSNQTGPAAQPSESALRSMAMRLHHRHSRLTARTRELQRHLAERENVHPASEGRDSFNPRSPGVTIRDTGRYGQNRTAWQAENLDVMSGRRSVAEPAARPERDVRHSLDSFDRMRRIILENPNPHGVEQAMEYLAELRGSASKLDSLWSASVLPSDVGREKPNDFIIDLSVIPPPAESSFLRAGAVLSGSQHSTNIISSTSPAGQDHTTPQVSDNNPSRSGTRSGYIPMHARRLPTTVLTQSPPLPSQTTGSITTHSPHHDRWPVKVTLHTVDYENLKLTATMEAYNVSSQPIARLGDSHLSPSSPIRTPAWTSTSTSTAPANNLQSTSTPTRKCVLTYLEGEILDFRTHTFLTESFPSNIRTDATYWRRLSVFQQYSDVELAHKLTSVEFLRELREEWVFMRWKERCFVRAIRGVHRGGEYDLPQSPTSAEPPAGTMDPTNANAMDLDSNTQPSSTSQHPRPSQPSNTPRAANIPPTTEDQESCGLTIRGFYYAAMRRSDGSVEGLYYDPHSNPYQHLRLGSVRSGGGGGGGWAFR